MRKFLSCLKQVALITVVVVFFAAIYSWNDLSSSSDNTVKEGNMLYREKYLSWYDADLIFLDNDSVGKLHDALRNVEYVSSETGHSKADITAQALVDDHILAQPLHLSVSASLSLKTTTGVPTIGRTLKRVYIANDKSKE